MADLALPAAVSCETIELRIKGHALTAGAISISRGDGVFVCAKQDLRQARNRRKAERRKRRR